MYGACVSTTAWLWFLPMAMSRRASSISFLVYILVLQPEQCYEFMNVMDNAGNRPGFLPLPQPGLLQQRGFLAGALALDGEGPAPVTAVEVGVALYGEGRPVQLAYQQPF